MIIFNKKGAMFGLDARIALAIFGALSVISGAALYSAIQDSKATAFLADITELGKAWEQYLLDTGSDLPAYSNVGNGRHFRDMTGLIEDNGVIGWKGPYLSYEKHHLDNKHLIYPNAGSFLLVSAKNSTWGGANGWQDGICLLETDKCFIWGYTSGFTKSVFETLDNRLDNGDGESSGSIRYEDTPNIFYIKLYPYASPEYQ
jgi:hypothetical protein